MLKRFYSNSNIKMCDFIWLLIILKLMKYQYFPLNFTSYQENPILNSHFVFYTTFGMLGDMNDLDINPLRDVFKINIILYTTLLYLKPKHFEVLYKNQFQ